MEPYQEPAQPPTTPRRDFLKCERCRKHKRKCVPQVRDWSLGEKCQWCEAVGAPCGPNIPHHRSSVLPSPTSPNTSFTTPGSSRQNLQPGNRTPGVRYTLTPTSASPRPLHGQRPGHEYHHRDRVVNVKDFIRNKLVGLGNLVELFGYLRNREDAVIKSRPQKPTLEYNDIRNLVTTVLEFAHKEISHESEQIITALAQVPRNDRELKELFLRRLNDKLTCFLACQPAQAGDVIDDTSPDDYAETRKMHCCIISQLATACNEAGDLSASFQFQSQLGALQDVHRLDKQTRVTVDGEAYRRMSARMSEALESLQIPQRYAKLLPKVDNCFPATHLAIYGGNPNVSYDMIKEGRYHPDQCDILSRRVLHIAAETRDSELLRVALQRDPYAKAQIDVLKMTPLCIAAYIGHIDTFTDLAEHGDDFSKLEINGRSVLCITAEAGNLAMVQHLLECGCNPDATAGLDGSGTYSALHAAAAGGFADIVQELLSHHAWVLVFFNDRTPADEARLHGHEQLAERLDEEIRLATPTMPLPASGPEEALHNQFLHGVRSNSLSSTTPSSTPFMHPALLAIQHDASNYPALPNPSPIPPATPASFGRSPSVSTPSRSVRRLKRSHLPSRPPSTTPSSSSSPSASAHQAKRRMGSLS